MALKKYINKKKITQYGIAERLGISPAYLSLILSGKRRLTERLRESIGLFIKENK